MQLALTVFLLLFFSLQVACATGAPVKSDHFNGKTFYNPWLDRPTKGFLQVLKWKMTTEEAEWPKWVDDNVTPQVATSVPKEEIHVTLINHATLLIQLHGLNILTDPVFEWRSSPVSWAGPFRHRSPGIEFDQLPKIDAVLISHNHYDHLSVDSIKKLAQIHNPLFIVPLGNEKLLKSAGAKRVAQLDWGQKTPVLEGVQVNCVPVQHWSARSLFDRNEALWSGFVIEAYGKKIYFGGDTGYGPHFKETFKKFGAMDLAMLPVGAYEPRWFMKDYHLNPEEAVQASLDLGAKMNIGMHFGTFQLTDEAIEQPVIDLKTALETRKISPETFVAPKNGTTIVVK
jgi:L-ascorbate metabolism protein UlaG (beta-lactamase superfamily)